MDVNTNTLPGSTSVSALSEHSRNEDEEMKATEEVLKSEEPKDSEVSSDNSSVMESAGTSLGIEESCEKVGQDSALKQSDAGPTSAISVVAVGGSNSQPPTEIGVCSSPPIEGKTGVDEDSSQLSGNVAKAIKDYETSALRNISKRSISNIQSSVNEGKGAAISGDNSQFCKEGTSSSNPPLSQVFNSKVPTIKITEATASEEVLISEDVKSFMKTDVEQTAMSPLTSEEQIVTDPTIPLLGDSQKPGTSSNPRASAEENKNSEDISNQERKATSCIPPGEVPSERQQPPLEPGAGEPPLEPGAGEPPLEPGAGEPPLEPGAGGPPVEPAAGGFPVEPPAGERLGRRKCLGSRSLHCGIFFGAISLAAFGWMFYSLASDATIKEGYRTAGIVLLSVFGPISVFNIIYICYTSCSCCRPSRGEYRLVRSADTVTSIDRTMNPIYEGHQGTVARAADSTSTARRRHNDGAQPERQQSTSASPDSTEEPKRGLTRVLKNTYDKLMCRPSLDNAVDEAVTANTINQISGSASCPAGTSGKPLSEVDDGSPTKTDD